MSVTTKVVRHMQSAISSLVARPAGVSKLRLLRGNKMTTYDVTGLPWYEDGAYQGLGSDITSLEEAQSVAQSYQSDYYPGIQIRGTDGTDIHLGDGGPNKVPFLLPLTEQY